MLTLLLRGQGLKSEEIMFINTWAADLREVALQDVYDEGVVAGVFSMLASKPDEILYGGFEAIAEVSSAMYTDDNLYELGKAIQTGEGREIILALEARFSGGNLLSKELVEKFYHGGELRIDLGTSGLYAAVDTELSQVYDSVTLLGMLSIESIVSAMRQVFIMNGLDLNIGEMIGILAMRERMNIGEDVLKKRLASDAIDVMKLIGEMNLDGVRVKVRPFAVAAYFMAELVFNNIVVLDDVWATMYRFVPHEGFGCEHEAKAVVSEGQMILPPEASPELERIFKVIISGAEELDELWTGYRAIVGTEGGFTFRELFGGAFHEESCNDRKPKSRELEGLTAF